MVSIIHYLVFLESCGNNFHIVGLMEFYSFIYPNLRLVKGDEGLHMSDLITHHSFGY